MRIAFNPANMTENFSPHIPMEKPSGRHRSEIGNSTQPIFNSWLIIPTWPQILAVHPSRQGTGNSIISGSAAGGHGDGNDTLSWTHRRATPLQRMTHQPGNPTSLNVRGLTGVTLMLKTSPCSANLAMAWTTPALNWRSQSVVSYPIYEPKIQGIPLGIELHSPRRHPVHIPETRWQY